MCCCAGYGLKSAIAGHQIVTTLSISLVWIIYSAIPPLLLVVYRFLGRGSFLSWLCWLCFLVSSACGFLAILLLWNVYPAEVSYSPKFQVLRMLLCDMYPADVRPMKS